MRVVDVSARTPAGRRSFGSGFLVGSGLVVTARHVVCGDDGKLFDSPRVRFIEDGTPLPCEVAWPGRRDLDAALLRLDSTALSGAPVRWGQLVASGTGIDCEAAGFPASMQQENRLRDVEHMRGEINAGTGLLADRIYVDVKGAIPTAGGWAGMSGAALWCGPLLVGVIAWDPAAFGSGRLAAEPVTRLFADGGFRALVGEEVAVEAVELASPLPQVPARGPAYLLRADAQTARFRSRTIELAQLASWCNGDGVRIRLLTGPGGQGKTRIANELAARLRMTGQWVTQMIPEGVSLPEFIRKPLLAVVDYAETRPEQVGQIVLSAVAQPGRTPVRILLLARSAGDWWDRLRKQTFELEKALARASGTELPPLEDNQAGRAQAFTEAVTDYAAALQGIDWPFMPPDNVTMPELTDERFGSPLRLQMTALAALLGGGVASAEPVEEAVLGHEARYWERAATQEGLDLHEETLRRAVAAAVLCTAARETEAMTLLGHVPGLRDQPEDTRLRAAHWLRDLYPVAAGPGAATVAPGGSPVYWGALQPDLIAEHLVASVVNAAPDLLSSLLGETAAGQSHQALTVLTRAAAGRPQLTASLADLLTQLPALAPIAVQVATQSEQPKPLLAALDRLVNAIDPPVPLMRAMADTIPFSTQALARFAVTNEENLVAAYERMAADNPKTHVPDLAVALNNLSVRLGEVGRTTEALAANERAVQLYEQLTKKHAETYLPLLAGSVSNLAVRLGEVGRETEALATNERAVQLHQVLVLAKKDTYLPDLGKSLNNLSVRLAQAGRGTESLTAIEQAVAIREQLAEADPDANLPDLAMSLANLSTRLAEVGREAESLTAIQRAVRLYEQLAEANPDAHLPTLAMTLAGLSARLAQAGQEAELLAALERAVRLYEQLAEASPEAHLRTLAGLLNDLSLILGEAGRQAEALTANERAVQLHEQLAEASPDSYLAALAASLNNLSRRLGEQDRGTEALAGESLSAIERAVQLHEQLAEARPDIYLADLAASLSNLLVRLARESQTAASLAAIEQSETVEQATALQERTAESAPEANELARRPLRLRSWALFTLNKLGSSPPQAVLVAEQLLADCERLLGPDDPDTLLSRSYLDAAYLATEQIAEALPLQRQTHAGSERELGPIHSDTSPPVDVFTADEALAFLSDRTGLADRAGAGAVAGELGFLRLPLAQAAAVIASQHLTYQGYLDRLQSLPVEEYLIIEQSQPYPHGAAEATVLSLEAVRSADRGGVCSRVLELMAVLSAAGVPRELLNEAGRAGVLGRGRLRAKVTAGVVDAALARLAEQSLLAFSLDGQAVIADRLILRVVRDGLNRQGRLTAACRSAALVLDKRLKVLKGSQDRLAVRNNADQVAALWDHTAGAARETDGELAQMLLGLRFWALYYLVELGDSATQAIVIGEPLAADFERVMGASHAGTLATRNNLADAYLQAGRAAEAIPLHEQTLAVRERLLGADHLDTLTSRNNLAAAYQRAGRVAEAIPLFEQTVPALARVLGPDHPSTLGSRRNLAEAYRAVGRAD